VSTTSTASADSTTNTAEVTTTTGTGADGGFTATPIPFAESELDEIAFNGDGLVPAIVQDAGDHAVLMMAWMNPESLRKTLETGRTWFWSRSRQEFWCKGETSGDRQYVRSVHYDCDGDVLLVVVDQEGNGACHTGHRTCFYRGFGDTSATP
jgi:phosphoribosyl-AMP cyclohydrolase